MSILIGGIIIIVVMSFALGPESKAVREKRMKKDIEESLIRLTKRS